MYDTYDRHRNEWETWMQEKRSIHLQYICLLPQKYRRLWHFFRTCIQFTKGLMTNSIPVTFGVFRINQACWLTWKVLQTRKRCSRAFGKLRTLDAGGSIVLHLITRWALPSKLLRAIGLSIEVWKWLLRLPTFTRDALGICSHGTAVFAMWKHLIRLEKLTARTASLVHCLQVHLQL